MTLNASMIEAGKTGLDGLSIGVGVAAIINAMPAVSAVLTVIWMALRVYEMKTVQRWVRVRRLRRCRDRRN